MKKIATIMNELGFKAEGSNEVKKAFIKNLIQEAQTPRIEKLESQLSLFEPKQSAKKNSHPSKKVS